MARIRLYKTHDARHKTEDARQDQHAGREASQTGDRIDSVDLADVIDLVDLVDLVGPTDLVNLARMGDRQTNRYSRRPPVARLSTSKGCPCDLVSLLDFQRFSSPALVFKELLKTVLWDL